MPLLTPETDGQLLEAAVDIICKLASIVSARKALSDAVSMELVGLITKDEWHP